jgi:CheY-like chemotaxis protein
MDCGARRILVVDDDPVTALAHRNRLTRAGYHAEIAKDGLTCLERLPLYQPHALLLDLQMPQLSGLEVIKRIRAFQELRELPIFVFTSSPIHEVLDDCLKAGARQVFEKWNLTSALLLEHLETALSEDKS